MTSQIDRIYRRIAQASCPPGHRVIGPSKKPPHFYCSVCDAEWSAGQRHPTGSVMALTDASDDTDDKSDSFARWPYNA